MRLYLRAIVSLVVFAFLGTGIAFAQGGSTSVSGRATDPGGLAVAGVKIEATNTDTSVTYPAATNDAGIYSLPSLPPGNYRITAAKDGFESVVRPGVILHVADVVTIDFGMQVGQLNQSVTVEGGAPEVNTSSSSLGGLVESHEVANLPLNGRNYINLTLLQPGIMTNPNMSTTAAFTGTWFASNGATIRSNNFMLDGAIMQDLTAGTTATLSNRTLGIDGIQEYRVITSNFSADYGVSMGSQTVMVSKGGTNQFHGSAFEYFRNSVLDAANFFDKPTAANGERRLPEYQRNNFGGSFGGPIQKDKTFFFATFERLRENVGTTILDAVPAAGCHGAAGAVITNTACPQLGSTASVPVAVIAAPFLALFPSPNDGPTQFLAPFTQPDSDNFGQVRVDHVFSDKDSLFGRYTITNDSQLDGLAYPEFFVNPRYNRNQFLTLSENHIFSTSLLNNVRVSYSRTLSSRLSPTPANLIAPQYSLIAGYAFGQLSVGGFPLFGPNNSAAGPTSANGSIYTQNLYTISDDVSYTVGRHSLKFGVLINSFLQDMTVGGTDGTLSFGSLTTFLQGISSNFSAVTPGSNVNRTYKTITTGFYAQDDWRLLPRFTLNAGLRYEPAPEYYNEVHGISSALIHPATDTSFTVGPLWQNPTLHNFSPRLGFAWDVFGNGRTAVRGGASLMYDLVPFGIPLVGIANADPPFSSSSTANCPAGCTFTLPLTFTPAQVGKTVSTVQYNFQQARLYSENLTVEQQLPFSTVLSVSYVGSRGIHLEGAEEGNPNIPAGFLANGLPFWNPSAPLVKPNPAFANISVLDSNHDSSYNALEVGLVKRMSKGLQFQVSYTWAKLLDDTQGTRGDQLYSSAFRADPFGNVYDRGLATFDVPQTVVINAIYNLPSPKIQERVLSTLTNGWGLSGIFTAHSGFPFTPAETVERSSSGVSGGSTGFGGIDRPNWNPAFTGNVINGGPTQYFNPNAFVLQPVGQLGNLGRDVLLGPGFADLDFAVKKDTRMPFLGEAGSLEFRAEFFNIFNRPNFTDPNPAVFSGAATDTGTPLSTAGQITATVSTSRQIELSLRVIF
jgi:hypothetical protein